MTATTYRPPRARKGARALDALCRLHHVQPSFTAADGRRRRAPDEVLVAVLRALGVPLEGAGSADGLLAVAERALAERPMEPVLVARPRRPLRPVVTLPAASDPAAWRVELATEDGASLRHDLVDLAEGPPEATSLGGQTLMRRRLRLGASLEEGYHRLILEDGRRRHEALVVRAPGRCPAPKRGWGVFAPLHALRRQGDLGVGTYADLGELGAWAGELGASFVGLLPLFAAYLEGPLADPSPYLPASRLAWNEVYLALEELPEAGEEAVRRALAGNVLEAAGAALGDGRKADPVATMAAKRPVLEAAAEACHALPGRRAALEAWLAERPEVAAYARFRATRAGRPAAAEERYQRYVQWMTECQLAAATQGGANLYLDLPVGVHPEGFDPAWQPDSFVAGVSGGAPPDAFFSGGQDWGVRPLHPEGLRASGYGYVIAALRTALRHAGVVRIDHVMGLHRLYVVPDGADARHGTYLRYRADELHAIAVLEAARAGVGVVGEDLGTVPEEVRRAMRRDGMLRSSVWQFDASATCPLPTPPADAMVSLATHDLPPFAAFLEGLDLVERRGAGEISEADAEEGAAGRLALRAALDRALGAATLHEELAGCLLHLAASPAALVLVDVADLWLERVPQNRPGPQAPNGSFRRRFAWTLEHLVGDAGARRLLVRVAETRQGGVR